VDASSNVYVCDGFPDYSVREITSAGIVKTIAGGTQGTSNGVGTNAQFYAPFGILIDHFTNLFVGDASDGLVREISPVGTNWVVSTFAGGGLISSVDGTGTNAEFGSPYGVAEDNSGNVYVADRFNNNIRKITSAGVVTTLAGPGNSAAYLDGTGMEARFNKPNSVTVDKSGNIYVADGQNHVIRKITSAGVVSTLAGKPGSPGEQDGIGDEAQFFVPDGVVADSAGNIYVTDTFNGAIRQVTPAGVVSTIAGSAGAGTEGGYQDGPGGIALFKNPSSIAMDSAGNFYVADTGNNAIRMISTNYVVSTVAGHPQFDIYDAPIGGYVDGTGAAARFNSPQGIAVDNAGNLYVAEAGNHDIRKLFPPAVGSKTNATNWAVTTLAGVAGVTGSTDGVGANALFGFSYYNPGPTGIAIDGSGNLYVTDDGNNTIRGITPAGVVTTLAGLAGTVGNADGTGSDARFDAPFAIAVDSSGALYVSDQLNNTIRKGVFSAFAPASPVPFTPSLLTGQLTVTLLPPEANGQWRLATEIAWRNSGTTATGLAQGEYAVEFRDIPGYLAIPLSGPVAVTSGATTFLTNQYYATFIPDTNGGGGSLTINIDPSPPAGAGWRFLGDTSSYYPPGYSTNLAGGDYLIQFAPVARFVTPASLSVQIEPGFAAVLSVTYLLAAAPPGNVQLPVPVPPDSIGDLTDYPYGFNGQLQTDVGYGSGVAVQTNVVLTAAHLIFNDQTLSFVSQANWLYQEEAGAFSPAPLGARGWYVLSGYAAQRTNDVLGGLGPDQSSPQSRNLDVAALYFESPVADGGDGGYLPSDTSPNTWLSGAAKKMLVGYPVDGSQFGITNITNGLMYETGPQTTAFGLATDPVADQQVYTAAWFLSYPGNSGGPLYVQYDGYYYPAGVYLGTLFNGTVPYASAVRAIDSNVVSLISLAASLGDTGTNNSGGGVITIIPSLATSANNPGYLILQLGPPSAVQAGAAWKLTNQPDSYYSSANPSLQEITSTNALILLFKPVPGWNLPTNRSVTITPGLILTNLANYTVTNPVLTLDLLHGLGLSGTTNTTYQIQRNSSLTGGTWTPYLTNTLSTPGFNLITNKPGPGFYRALWLTN
jgi:sugar lactone lactonase YvrE